MQIDLNGKVGIVTGAAAGIGRELALTFAREGVKTVAVDRDEAGLEALVAQIRSRDGTATAVACDLLDPDQVQAAVDRVLAEHGRVDILVNNAGVALGGPIESFPLESWDLDFDVNVRGTFLMSRAVIPAMKRQRSGRIINAASFAAIVPSANMTAYAASKAAVHYFTRGLAGELGPWDITVNCYSPGMVPTGMNNFDTLPEPEQRRLLDTLTLRRWGKPADVASLVCFLASDLAAYITGTMIDVSGGKLATQRPYKPYENA